MEQGRLGFEKKLNLEHIRVNFLLMGKIFFDSFQQLRKRVWASRSGRLF